jgi:hypothetical protein
MRMFVPVLICCAIILTKCNKTTDGPETVDPNKNEMVGYITVDGRDIRLFAARGSNATSFTRTVEGNNTVITLTCRDTIRTVQLKLVNVMLPGTYSFYNSDTTAYNGTLGSYREGPESNPTLFYSTATTNPEIVALGDFQIFAITDSTIQGRIRGILGDEGEFSKVSFDDVLFKGNF